MVVYATHIQARGDWYVLGSATGHSDEPLGRCRGRDLRMGEVGECDLRGVVGGQVEATPKGSGGRARHHHKVCPKLIVGVERRLTACALEMAEMVC
jgi:hypothetical protein